MSNSKSRLRSQWMRSLSLNIVLFLVLAPEKCHFKDNYNEPNCGKPNEAEDGRIVAGTKVPPNRYPWLCLLRSDAGNCGSFLFNKTIIVTAAHCVVNPETGKKIEEIQAFCGCNKQAAFDSKLPCGQARTLRGKPLLII